MPSLVPRGVGGGGGWGLTWGVHMNFSAHFPLPVARVRLFFGNSQRWGVDRNFKTRLRAAKGGVTFAQNTMLRHTRFPHRVCLEGGGCLLVSLSNHPNMVPSKDACLSARDGPHR